MMNLWRGFEFLALIIHPWMNHNNQCLYNALVIKLRRQPVAYLLQVRDSLRELADFVEQEINERG